MRASRLFIVAGVLALGLAAAWPFHHSRRQLPERSRATAPLELTLRRPDGESSGRAISGISPAVGLETLASATANRDGAVGIPRASDMASVVPPPPLPISFDSTPAAEANRTNDWRPGPALTALFRRGSESQIMPRTYRIRDGDTLESIAQRFLGSRERAEEVFDRNRAVLSQPDLLPVGAVITLPPRAMPGSDELTGPEP